MEIHAPDKPIHSLKDFGVHIAIVTLGILIALGLDGVREMVHVHRLVRETRENFRDEMSGSCQNMALEAQRVIAGHGALAALAQDAPVLAVEHPEQVLERLQQVRNPNYFFSTNSWQAALSSGVLAHMGSDEASRYAWAAESTRIYSALQGKTMDTENRAFAFWSAHPHPTPDQIAEGEERILLYARNEEALADVAPQTQRALQHALEAASH